MTIDNIPKFLELHWPVIQAFRELQSSCRQEQLVEKVCEILELGDDIVSYPHGKGPTTEISYRIGWSKNALKNIDALVRLDHGLWALTKKGQKISEKNVQKEVGTWFANQRKRKTDGKDTVFAESDTEDDCNGDDAWKADLLETIRSMEYKAFERLAKRMLSKLGFDDIDIIGQSNDKGIDLQGVLRDTDSGVVISRVFVQCKRYSESNIVGPSTIRDFQGALHNKGPSAIGIFITSGRYTKGAREAVRDGMNVIDLVDGKKLVKMLKKTRLGIKIRKVVEIEKSYFSEI